ncbi:TraU family protein [Methylomonas sp. SURF-1]|uniref:TraU family protein n=1 Tax=Methylomonas aurea TaxID=2952224 RepID=A0ABT1UP57_9GAMM|nr:TraU family protein [Methylomonas sp. SURF-1]MCQ8183499.1 TraU family protein [Methylomonas sp. SURF-1]
MTKPVTWLELVLLCACLCSSQARAADALCPDAELWSGKLITDICWGCLFPIRLAGGVLDFRAPQSKGSGDSSVGDDLVPSSAASNVYCVCDGKELIPEVGMTMGYWGPARVVELVPNPWCAPTLGGTKINQSNVRLWGGSSPVVYDTDEIVFLNYHYYAFPIYVMLDLFWEDRCFADGYKDFDLLYVSELDPTWNNDELAFFTNPEVVLFANPVALAACSVDAVAASAGRPIDEMFWCAGAWGGIYPLSGHTHPGEGIAPRQTSLLMTRATAALHRRGLAHKTVGDDYVCGGTISPFIPKSQYATTMFYPVADTQSKHAIGESDLLWGAGHSYPGSGEYHVYILWRWTDCCLGF